MKNNFEYCVNQVLKSEGGYSNDPNDSGGATNRGITINDYRRFINRRGTVDNLKKLTLEQAKEIYREHYWNALDCDSLPSGVDYTVFDYGVNSGVNRSRTVLKKNSDKSGSDLINAINDERVSFLKEVALTQSKDKKFLRGWLLRVNRVRQTSLNMSKKDYTVAPAAGSATILTGMFASHFWQHYEWYILGGAVAAAAVIGLIVHFIVNKGK